MIGQAFSSAAFYSLFTNDSARIDREGPLLKQLLEAAPGTHVADIACGTGLHAAFFAELGADVDATDLSPDMIEHAKQVHPHGHISYRTADMTAVSGGPYDMVICLGNSLSLLQDDTQLAATFSTVAQCLSPGGIVLTQILNYARPESQKPRHRIERDTIDNTGIVGIKSLVPDGDRTLLTISWFIMTGTSPITRHNTAVLRHLTPNHLTDTAGQSGLKLEHLYGAYDGSPFDSHSSPDVIAVFKR